MLARLNRRCFGWPLLAAALLAYILLWLLAISPTSDVKLKPLPLGNAPITALPITLPFLEKSPRILVPPENIYHVSGHIALSRITTADTLVINVDNCPLSVRINGSLPPATPNFSGWKNCNFTTSQLLIPLSGSNLHPGVNDFEIIFKDEGGAYGINLYTKSVWLKKSLVIAAPLFFLLLMGGALGASCRAFRQPATGMAAALLLLGAWGVTLTYTALSQTYDESAHIPAGMQWWDKDMYTYEYMHTPLARIAGSALLYLADITPHGDYRGHFTTIGNRLLNTDDAYIRNLTLARLGILPFYLLAGAVIYLWSRRLYGEKTGLLSLLLYALSPMIAAHAGLATTDFTYGALFVTALYAFVRWLETPTRALSLFFGVSAGLMLLTKISALMQFPVAALMILEWHIFHERQQGRAILAAYPLYLRRLFYIALPAAALLVEACYGFDHFEGLRHAIAEAAAKNKANHATWLLGPLNSKPVWFYFPVAFFFKNPLPLLALAATGAWANMRARAGQYYQHRSHFPVIAAFAVILASMPSHINIGARHVMPAFILICIPAGHGLMRLFTANRPTARPIAALLLAWLSISYMRIAPDYLSYQNEAANLFQTPVLIDSDLDWGQDLLRLKAALQDKQIHEVAMCYFGNADLPKVLGVKVNPCPLENKKAKPTGWLAVSLYNYELRNPYDMLKDKPYTMVGKAIRLYNLKP